MGVHTGDSVTVAPALTLTDAEYQELRDAAKAIIRKIGVETGGSNVQFAVNPENGDVVVIEMNPRVSRSSALASKATGFPIAKIAAKLAVGYTLDEIPNDITRKTPACFEPTLDYVVVKMPRWAFEKFPMADTELTTQMKSVGEAMAIGRTFKEAFQKAMRSRELDSRARAAARAPRARAGPAPCPPAERYELVLHAFRQGLGIDEVHELTGDLAVLPRPSCATSSSSKHEVRRSAAGAGAPELLRRMKRYGFSDKRLGELTGRSEREVRALRVDARHHAGLQGGGHLRRRVRGRDAVLLLDLRGARTRPCPGEQRARRHPGQRPQPHRPGHRVRLLLRPRRARRRASSATRRSWSTATPRRCSPTTTSPTGSTSSR